MKLKIMLKKMNQSNELLKYIHSDRSALLCMISLPNVAEPDRHIFVE